MRASSSSSACCTAALCVVVAGCQIYLSGGPGGGTEHAAPYDAAPVPVYDPPPRAAAPAPVPPPAHTPADPLAADSAAAPEADFATDVAAADPPAALAPAAASPGATYPGERYYRAGAARVAREAAEDALVARDFRILRSGTSSRGGEIHAERRARLASPATTSSPAWTVQAAVVRITGSTWDDCCYVKAAFTTTRLNSRGDVLGTTAADEPENDVLRTWFFDDLGSRLPAPAAY